MLIPARVRISVSALAIATALSGSLTGWSAAAGVDTALVPSATTEVTTTTCPVPATGEPFAPRSPSALGFDPVALTAAIRFGARQASTSVRVYRHGCLAGKSSTDAATERLPYPLASASKGVLSLAVGRAVTLGKVDLDAPIRRYIAGLDAAHGDLTTRMILQQVTGLKFSWGADVSGYLTDASHQALALPFAHAPGTTFEYSQSILSVLAKIVEHATKTDFLVFLQRELFDKVGIPRNHWVWIRDVSGTALVAGGMAMRPDDQARLGQLLLNRGTWAGQRVIAADYVDQAQHGTPANPGYGFLYWLNEGAHYKTGSLPVAEIMPHRFFPGSPPDTFAFVGALGQLIIMIPSRDIIVIRNGLPNKLTSYPAEGFSAEFNREFKDLPRRVVLAVTDVPPVTPADNPYNHPPATEALHSAPFDVRTLVDPGLILGNLLGLGPNSGCNLLTCVSRAFPQQLGRLAIDTVSQVRGALLASLIG